MPQFTVDEDLAALVEQLAQPKPFENLSFNSALRRVLQQHIKPKKADDKLEKLLAESMALAKRMPKKALSPSPGQWAASVPDLKGKKGLTTWQAICDLLKIETADSARRKLRNWVKANRPAWPPVPALSGD